MCWPSIHDTPLDLSTATPRQSTLDQLLLTARLLLCLLCQHRIRRRPRLSSTRAKCCNTHQFIETASRRRTAVLRVLRERDGATHAVALHLFETSLGQWLGVPKHDVWLVRCGFRVELVEKGAHGGALRARPTQDRGAAAYLCVLFFDLGRSALGDDRCEVVLEGQRDKIVVVEKTGEEVMDFGDLTERVRGMDLTGIRGLTVEGPPMFIMTTAFGRISFGSESTRPSYLSVCETVSFNNPRHDAMKPEDSRFALNIRLFLQRHQRSPTIRRDPPPRR